EPAERPSRDQEGKPASASLGPVEQGPTSPVQPDGRRQSELQIAKCKLQNKLAICNYHFAFPLPCLSVVYLSTGTSAHSSVFPSGHVTRTRTGLFASPRPASTRGSLADA